MAYNIFTFYYFMRITLKGVVLIAISAYFLASCNRAPSYSIIPAIHFVSLAPTTVHENDSIAVVFGFTDGDGDIGRGASDTITSHNDIVFYDNRVSDPTKPKATTYYRVPDITPFGKVKAVSGNIHITVHGVYRRLGYINDTLSYTIRIKDRAGHWSNSISTSSVIITP